MQHASRNEPIEAGARLLVEAGQPIGCHRFAVCEGLKHCARGVRLAADESMQKHVFGR
jgi:hypothetical protein